MFPAAYSELDRQDQTRRNHAIKESLISCNKELNISHFFYRIDKLSKWEEWLFCVKKQDYRRCQCALAGDRKNKGSQKHFSTLEYGKILGRVNNL